MTFYRSAVSANDFHNETRAFFDRKRVVVTGGGGFIGSHMTEQLLVLGARVTVLSRRGTSEFIRHIEASIDSCICDLTDRQQTREAMSRAEVVMHLAADVGGLEYNMAHPATIFDSNMQIGMNVLDGARENAVSRTFLCSSACVYPRDCTVPTPESEGFKDEPEVSNSGYGWAKRMLELLGAKYAQQFGMAVAIARPYNAYGPRDNFASGSSHVIPALIAKAVQADGSNFPVWGDGSATRSFLFADDFARGLIEVAARFPGADPLNIGTDEEISIKDLASKIADISYEMTGKRPVPVFDPTAPSGQPRRNCDTSKTMQNLGFASRVGLDEGLRKTMQWYLNQ